MDSASSEAGSGGGGIELGINDVNDPVAGFDVSLGDSGIAHRPGEPSSVESLEQFLGQHTNGRYPLLLRGCDQAKLCDVGEALVDGQHSHRPSQGPGAPQDEVTGEGVTPALVRDRVRQGEGLHVG